MNAPQRPYRAYSPRPFKREERDAVEILFGGLGWRAEKLIQAAFENLGYRTRPLPNATRDDLLAGRELADIGQCCSTSFTTGNLARFLGDEAKRIGPDNVSEKYVYLTAGACGAWRFGQYHQSYELALRNIGLSVALVPKEYVAESLIEALHGQVAQSCILLARAAAARDIVPDELRKAGAIVDVVDAYRTVIPASSVELIRKVNGIATDAITFTSSSTVTNFFQLVKSAGTDAMPDNIKAISIGPITSATLREHGWEPAAEANPHDVNGLVQAVLTALGCDTPPRPSSQNSPAPST